MIRTGAEYPAAFNGRRDVWAGNAERVNAGGKISSNEFREALSKVASAVTVVSTDGPSGAAGLTCSAVCAVSDAPPTLLVCVNRNSAANPP